MIVVIDYGVGNLGSVVKALESLDVSVKLSKERKDIIDSEGIILPGVGAFGTGMKNLKKDGLDLLLKEATRAGKPLLGICLGLQLLFEKSEEDESEKGLGLISGRVEKFTYDNVQKIPHMGWNTLEFHQDNNTLSDIDPPYYFYFVHSFYVVPEDETIISGRTQYSGQNFASFVQQDNIWGIQCHPEKSSETGLKFLNNFVEYCRTVEC